MRTILGFDFGFKRLGIAVGQDFTGTTQPLATVPVSDQEPDWPHIDRLIEEWQPQVLLVGLPLNMDGSEQHMTHAARRFAKLLRTRYGLTVELVDERLTSSEAQAIVAAQRRDKQLRRRKSKHVLDAIAAELIIKTWLG